MKKLLFVCVGNSCRSIMAEAWLNALISPDRAIAMSAGTEPAEEVNPLAIRVMKEAGISIENKKPRMLTPEMNMEFDYIITMGCMEGCPVTPREKTIKWNIYDPKGKPVEKFREVRDTIKREVEKLIYELRLI